MNTYMEGVRDALSRVGFRRRSSNFGFMSFVCGAGVGLLAGAAIALLVAPTSGQEVRRELGSRAKRLAERTQDAISEAKQNMKGKLGAESQEYSGRNEIPMG
jgi:gas vesicle protein